MYQQIATSSQATLLQNHNPPSPFFSVHPSLNSQILFDRNTCSLALYLQQFAMYITYKVQGSR